jgi:hypothetical protein
MVIGSRSHGRTRVGATLVLPVALTVGCASVAERPKATVPSSDPAPAAVAPAAVAEAVPTPWRSVTLADLVRDSPLVFRGRVSEQASERDSRGLIVTRTTFAVDEVLVGPRDTSMVTLTTLGGRVGNEEMTATHVPRFAPEPTYIVFADPTRTTYTPVTADEHGVFIIDSVQNRVLTADSRIVLGVEGGELRLGPFMPPAGADPRTKAGGLEQAPQVSGAIIKATTATLPEPAPRPVTPEAFAAAIRSLGAGR